MQELKAKCLKEKQAEEIAMSAFNTWCTDTEVAKKTAISDAAEKIEKLESDIAADTSTIEDCADRIEELSADIARWEKDGKAATKVRDEEAKDYKTTITDYFATLDAIERAIQVLKTFPSKTAQPALLQMKSSDARQVRDALTSWLQVATKTGSAAPPISSVDVEPPQANAYEQQSGGIIPMLQELKEKFRDEATALEKEELSSLHAFEAVMMKLKQQIALANQEIDQKTKLKAETEQHKAECEGDLASTKQMKASDEKYLAELQEMCTTKATDFESRQKLRDEEMEALQKAIDIIGGKAVHGEHLPSLVQIGSAHALAQLRSVSLTPNQEKAVAWLKKRAAAINSHVLALAAETAEKDPFEKVKKMIKALIVKLMEEANSEANEKGWCDTELGTNKLTRENKQEEVEKLMAEVEGLQASIAQLGQDIADLSAEMSEIAQAIAKAEAERMAEKEENEATVADAKESQEAVASAIAVLRDFYAKASEATAFAQGPAEDAPATFDSPFKGNQGSSKGIIGMLEVIESDFARLEAETSESETSAQESFEKFVAESEQEKAVKATTLDHKQAKKTSKEELLVTSKKALEDTDAELEAANEYYEKLKPKCVEVDWSTRDKRREEEIESLKDAYAILSGEGMPSSIEY